MNRTDVMQEIRIMRFVDVYERHQSKRLSLEEAAELLGICERSFRRWCRRYEEEGAQGLYDRRLGKIAHNAVEVDEVMELLNLFETHYGDFSVAHFYDKWRTQHGGHHSYTWVKNQLQKAGHVKKLKKRGTHRRKRERKPLPGMMLHQDGSTHEWVAGQQWDLIITLDDATSELYSAFFVEEEGTWSSFRGLQDVIEQHGLFCSLYTDRGSHYWNTPTVGGKVDKQHYTQVRRALHQLGIEMIPSYSPQARGRCERVFKTLQDRLVKELKVAKVQDMQQANHFLRQEFLPVYNQRFAVKAAEEGSAFVPWLSNTLALEDSLCIQEQRIVRHDNTVCYQGKVLQIPKTQERCHYVKAQVRVHEYPEHTLAIFHGPRCLGRYDQQGRYLSTTKYQPSLKSA